MSRAWDRFRQSGSMFGFSTGRGRSGGDVELLGRGSSTHTVRLGRVQPQAPTHRTIYCNDRDSNLPVRFKVLSGNHSLFFFSLY